MGVQSIRKDQASIQKRTDRHDEPHPRKRRPPPSQVGWPGLPSPDLRWEPKHFTFCCKSSGRLPRSTHRCYRGRPFRNRPPVPGTACTSVQAFVCASCKANHLTNRAPSDRQRPRRLSRQGFATARQKGGDTGTRKVYVNRRSRVKWVSQVGFV